MTVAQLLDELSKLPQDAVVIMENGPGLSRVSELELIASQGLGAPAEVLLRPHMDE